METARLANGPAKVESTAPTAKFLWIQSDDLQQAQGMGRKPQSQKYSTAARKHVMRGERIIAKATSNRAHEVYVDIGHSRKLRKRRRTTVVELELAAVRRPQSLPIEATMNSTEPSNSAYSTLQQIPAGLDGGRLDPFIKWPVIITKRMHWLLDHCALSCIFLNAFTLSI